MSDRELLHELAGISETVLLYRADRGRPRAHRMLTETSPVQDKLAGIFGLDRYAPPGADVGNTPEQHSKP